VFLSEGLIAPSVAISTDFQTTTAMNSPSFTGSVGTAWDDGDWDSFDWSGGDTLTAKWQSATGVGYAAGVNISLSVKNIGCKWMSTDFVYEVGSVL
jgi:hypothetical protein